MVDPPLPEEFDIIVIGTGLVESVVSGALSRVGKSVLHLDWNDFYGGSWASFNIKAFEDYLIRSEDSFSHLKFDLTDLTDSSEVHLPVSSHRRTLAKGSSFCHLAKSDDVASEGIARCITDDQPLDSAEEDKEAKIPESTNDEQTAVESSSVAGSDTAARGDEGNGSSVGGGEGAGCAETSTTAKSLDEPPDTSHDKKETTTTDNASVENVASDAEEGAKKFSFPTQEEFYDQWRRFNIDLAPKVIFSRGKLVELLIQSNVARYLEFRNVTRTLTLLDGQTNLQPVPCSRADVFSSKFVTMVEKRILMRVLTLCANYEAHPEEYEAFQNKSFMEFLHSKKLSKKVQHFILHSIAMVTDEASTLEGLEATRKFLHSLGRYGNSAFLWPMYGVGELPQAFSRLSAVFGGTFCLRRSAVGLVLDKESLQLKAIVDTQGQKIKCKHLVIDEASVPDQYRCDFTNAIARAVYVTNKSVLSSDSEHVSLITLPPAGGNKESVRLIEAGPQCCLCPQKCYIVHALLPNKVLSSDVEEPASVKDRFRKMEDVIFAGTAETSADTKEQTQKPTILWAAYFNMLDGGVVRDALPSNVHVTSGPGAQLGFDEAMEKARRIFQKICPEEEFLPRAPDHEEIVFDDEVCNTENNGSDAVDEQEEGGGGGDPVDEDDTDLREERENDVLPKGDASDQQSEEART